MNGSTDNVFVDYRAWLGGQTMPPGKRKALLAGLEVFAANGYDGASTQQIADAAGISQATIFKYFKTKRELLLAILEPIVNNMFGLYQASFIAGIPDGDDLRAIVNYIVTDRLHFLQVNADAVIILLTQVLTNADLRQQGLNKLMYPNKENDAVLQGVQIMQQLQAVGKIRPEMTVADIFRTIIGQLGAYFLQRYLVSPEEPVGTMRDVSVLETTIYNGLAVQPESASVDK
ncbi:TetR/AcrR family transcriptional regulator [Lacticaseibacillus pantheris]